MKQIFLLFSHKLTPIQREELEKDFSVDKIIGLPIELQSIWSNIPPEPPTIKNHLKDIFNWLKEKSKPNDLVLVQGEFGAVYMTVDFCKKIELVPIYATTKRKVIKETLSDETVKVKRVFTHVRFRKFERWQKSRRPPI